MPEGTLTKSLVWIIQMSSTTIQIQFDGFNGDLKKRQRVLDLSTTEEEV